MRKSKIVFSFNAPAVLLFALLSLIALGLNIATGGTTNRMFFSVYRSSISPLYFVRLFGHVLGHSSFSHYVSNMAYILALGSIVEDRYGSGKLLLMFAVTALVSGVFHLFFGAANSALLGASGIVYMLIFLAATAGSQPGEIPLTLVAVAALYLSQEIFAGLFTPDNISHLTHIVGGVCGAVIGLFWRN